MWSKWWLTTVHVRVSFLLVLFVFFLCPFSSWFCSFSHLACFFSFFLFLFFLVGWRCGWRMGERRGLVLTVLLSFFYLFFFLVISVSSFFCGFLSFHWFKVLFLLLVLLLNFVVVVSFFTNNTEWRIVLVTGMGEFSAFTGDTFVKIIWRKENTQKASENKSVQHC